MDKSKEENSELNQIIDSLTSADFDGHTEFSSLSPKQKLEWLSQASHFIMETRKLKTN